MPAHLAGDGDDRPAHAFATTQWSLVLQAGGTEDSAHAALETLCRTYWYPIYAFVRRRGHDTHHAQDLTQEFFARLLANDSLQTARQERGRFRTFLLGALKNFLANDWRDSRRLKRGGGAEILSWESLDPERRYAAEPVDGETPESLFDRRWAHSVVTAALDTLGAEMRRDGTGERFSVLQSFLQGGGDDTSYTAASERIGLSVPATKSAIFRMRKRYGALIRENIAQTVATHTEVEGEIQHLVALLARP